MIKICRRLLVLVLAVTWVLMRSADAASEATPTFDRPLAGQYLVAAPSLVDPHFAETVVLIISHDSRGAFGLIVNRRIGLQPLQAFLDSVGASVHATGAESEVPVHDGGPVERQRVFLLHSTDYREDSTRSVADGVSLTTGDQILAELAAGRGPRKLLVIVGYAGWGPGQLEAEMNRADWLLAPVSGDAVFTDDPDGLWEEVLQRAGTPL